MKKILLYLITLMALIACNNEDDKSLQYSGLQVNADFIKLSDGNSTLAGNLVINTDAPEITLKWNTESMCNLDTAQTTLKVSNGRATLPIKWINKLKDGGYGPKGVGFKAGVQLVAGKEVRYIPLIWADKVDSAKVIQSVRTRSVGDIMPRVSQISFVPTTVNMNDQTGGTMLVNLTNVPYALFDKSEFNSDMNIDMNNIPEMITASQSLSFQWTAAGPPAFGFSARLVAMSEEIVVYAVVDYTPGGTGGQGGTLNYVTSNLPAGNIPKEGGTYTFTFEGTYTGTVQLRALSDGAIIATGQEYVNKLPQITIPQNTAMTTRNITFQYKRGDGVWTDLPATTNRIQDKASLGIVVGGITWAPGNLMKAGYTYQFYASQEQYSGIWNGADYWNWNVLDVFTFSTSVTGYWNTAKDPCLQVAPAGTWRSPNSYEMQTLVNTVNSWGYYNGRAGRYFGPNNELFLPAAGYRPKNQSIIQTGATGLYWSSTTNVASGSATFLGVNYQVSHIDPRGHRAMGCSIRCVQR